MIDTYSPINNSDTTLQTPPIENLQPQPQIVTELPQKTTPQWLWILVGGVITLLAVGGFWAYSKTATNKVAMIPSPTPAMTDTTQPTPTANPKKVPLNLQATFKQVCTRPKEQMSDYYEVDLTDLPFTFPAQTVSKYTDRTCYVSTDSTGFVELYQPLQTDSERGATLWIGDENSVVQGMAPIMLSLAKFKAEFTQPLKELPVDDYVTLVVDAAPRGEPCQGTEKSIYVDMRAYKEKEGYVLLAGRGIHVTDTSAFADLLQKYGTPHTVGPEDQGCEFGQQYDFTETEKINGFSREFLERYFSSYQTIPAPYKAEAQALVNDVSEIERK
jgi:hypothetical protein